MILQQVTSRTTTISMQMHETYQRLQPQICNINYSFRKRSSLCYIDKLSYANDLILSSELGKTSFNLYMVDARLYKRQQYRHPKRVVSSPQFIRQYLLDTQEETITSKCVQLATESSRRCGRALHSWSPLCGGRACYLALLMIANTNHIPKYNIQIHYSQAFLP